MKKFIKFVLLLVVAGMLFTFAACDSSSGGDDEDDYSYRSFRAQEYNTGAWYTTRAALKATGTYCTVYVEEDVPVTRADAAQIAAEFDDKIFNQITTSFGAHRDVDHDEKLTLLLLDIVDGYIPPNGAYVQGYFDPTHMARKTDNSNSNECDMIFLDVDPVEPGSEEFFTTIAHEFQHLINFSRTYMEDGRLQDIWINEGLSSGAEYVYSREINQVRVDHFNYDPYGSIVYGNNFFVWDGFFESRNSNTVLDNYATVNLFFQWLRIHASNGTAIYKQILDSTNRDYQAVTTAAASEIASVYGDWPLLLETWYLANFRCQSSGYYGYKTEIETKPVFFLNSDDADLFFEPGEAVISALSTDTGEVGTWDPPSGSGANIQYAGFDYAGTTVDRDPSFTNEFAIVYNANTDNTSGAEEGFVANVVAAPGDNPVARSIQARIDANKKELPKKFAVGFHPGYAGSGETPEQRLLKNKAGFAPAATIQGKKGY